MNLTLIPRREQILPSASAGEVTPGPSGTRLALPWPEGGAQTVKVQSSVNLSLWDDLDTLQTNVLGNIAAIDPRPAPPEGRRFYRPKTPAPYAPIINPGHALSFDGTNGLVTVPHDPAFNSYPLTCTAWVLTTTNDATNRGIVEKYGGGPRNGWMMFLHQGRLRAFCFSDANNKIFTEGGDFNGMDGGPIADGFWHHCTLTVDATGGKLYVDGTLRSSLVWTGIPGACTTTTALKFGKYDTVNSFIGNIEEVTVWNTALTQPEIAEAIRVPPNPGAPGLLSIWRFDGAAGTSAGSSTSAGFNGILSGNVQWLPSTAPIYR